MNLYTYGLFDDAVSKLVYVALCDIKLYRTVIRQIVTYASETWVLKETIIQKLSVFERKEAFYGGSIVNNELEWMRK
jgi:hypothetical protein